MAFEVYEKRPTPSSEGLWVTISRGGQISVSKEAHDSMGSPERVLLLWDPDEEVWALAPAKRDDPRSFSARNYQGRAVYVSARGFLRAHPSIPLGREQAHWDGERLIVCDEQTLWAMGDPARKRILKAKRAV